MTVATELTRKQYVGNGSTTVFSFPYKFYLDADVIVILTVDATNVDTVQTITTHYTLTGAGGESGGNVTMITAPATGETLTIYRDMDVIQDTDLSNQGAFYLQALEDALDYCTMVSQELAEIAGRCIKNSIVNGTSDIDADEITEAGENALASETAAAVSAAEAESSAAAAAAAIAGVEQRSTFRYKDADEIYLGAAAYLHIGTATQLVYWGSELTYPIVVSGQMNKIIYLYLDDSAIVTNASPILDETCFIDSLTAPTWSASKRGWYNGDDCCIGAFLLGAANNVLKFYHDGSYFKYAEDTVERAATALNTTWVEVDLLSSVPAFTKRAKVSFRSVYVAGSDCLLKWRTNNNTDDHYISNLNSSINLAYVSIDVITDTSQIIEIQNSTTDDNTVQVDVEGWYFPDSV